MSALKDVIGVMKDVLLLTEKVEKTGTTLSEVSKEIREHDRRLIRLETIIELAQSQTKRIE